MRCNMGHFGGRKLEKKIKSRSMNGLGASTELNEINFATLKSGDFKGITYSDADYHTNGQSGLGAVEVPSMFSTKTMIIYGVGVAALIAYFMYMRKKA